MPLSAAMTPYPGTVVIIRRYHLPVLSGNFLGGEVAGHGRHGQGTEDTDCVHNFGETLASKCFPCAAPPEASLAAACRHGQTRDWFVVEAQSIACHVSRATKRTKIDWPMRPCTLRHTCSVSTTTTALETTSRRTRRAASAFRCCSTRLAPSPPRDTELGATARASPNTGDSNCSWRQRCRAHPWSVITKESAHWRDSLRAERLPAQQNRCAVNFVTTGQARPVGACGACRRREAGRLAHLNARKLRHLVGT